jgi:hypothetical protein
MTEESPIQSGGCVSESEVRELIAEWRESAEDIAGSGLWVACREERLACAEELEALLQE